MNDCLSTNIEKAARVAAYVADYCAKYEGGHGEPPETFLADIIADIGHWYAQTPDDLREDCDENRTIRDWFEGILQSASRHFNAELDDEERE
jgi:hypothetical protein